MSILSNYPPIITDASLKASIDKAIVYYTDLVGNSSLNKVQLTVKESETNTKIETKLDL